MGEDSEDEPRRRINRAELASVLRRSWHGLMRHRGIDSAASLTFFATLATFPGTLALVSVLAIVDDREGAVVSLLNAIDSVAKHSTVSMLAEPLEQFAHVANPWWALAIGLALTIWSVSAYATAFGRAVNGAYEISEGRPFWKFRGLMLVLTIPFRLCSDFRP